MYELDELDEGFSDAEKYHPIHKSSPVPIKELLAPITTGPVIALRSAAENKDRAAFAAAFDDLTLACNTCHEATSFGFNVKELGISELFSFHKESMLARLLRTITPLLSSHQ